MELDIKDIKLIKHKKKEKKFNERSYNLENKDNLKIIQKEYNKYRAVLNKINFIIIFYICLIISLHAVNNINRIIYSQYSYITLKINSTGNISFYHFNKDKLDFTFCVPHPAEPDEIFINGVNQSHINPYYYFQNLENNVTLIWKNSLKTTICMFKSCSKITEMDFSNFDTSQVTDMYAMFSHCSSLTLLNLSNFNTSKVTDMSSMFQGCESLKSLVLSYFETSQVTSMYSMFSRCSSLTTLDLSNFNTSKNFRIDSMFEECSSLISLDISNFKIFLNDHVLEGLFSRCSSLEYINAENAKIYIENEDSNYNYYYNYMFYEINENIIICSNDYKWNEILKGSNITINCNNNTKYQCFKKNLNTPYYKDICKKYDEGYYQINDDENYNNSYINSYPTQIKNNNLKTDEPFYLSTQTDNNIPTDYILETELTLIENNINYLIKQFNKTYIDNGNDIEIEKGNIKYSLTNTNNQRFDENKNKTSINLGLCENRLKSVYNISYNNSLYITKIIIKEEGMKIPKIEYEVYYPLNNNSELIQLNLSICKDIRIDISIPVHLNKNLDKYNISSDYYNNLCSKTTSESGTDISITDRKKQFIDNNMTLCEEDCKLIAYNYTNEKAKCSCLVKIKIPLLEQIKFDKKYLYNSFTDIKNFANINLMKCYKSVFNLNSLKKNYGFFFYTSIILLYFITLFLFCFKFYFSLIEIIQLITEAKSKIYPKDKNKNKKPINNSENNNRKKLNLSKKNKKIKFKNNKDDMFPPRRKKEKNIINKIDNINKIQSYKNKNLKKNKNIRKIERSINQNFLDTTFINRVNNDINNKIKKYEKILQYNDYEINTLIYKEAILYDKRTYFQYYLSLLRTNHLLIFAFYNNNKDYNSKIIKIFLFFFFFCIHFMINALFFDDKTMHRILIDEGSFNFFYQIPKIIYSFIISGVINTVIKFLSLSEKNIIKFKREKKIGQINLEKKQIIKILKNKFIIFFIVSFFLLFFSAYYISCFCGIYVNNQIHLIKDTLISFSLSLLYPLGIYLIPGIFRITALNSKKKDRNCLYKFSQLIQLLC